MACRSGCEGKSASSHTSSPPTLLGKAKKLPQGHLLAVKTWTFQTVTGGRHLETIDSKWVATHLMRDMLKWEISTILVRE